MLKILKDDYETKVRVVLFSTNEGEEAGRFTLEIPDFRQKNPRLSVWSLQIFEQFRGRKLCNQMMVEAVEMMRKEFPRCNSAYLTVRTNNIPAIKAYEFAGFRITNTDDDNWKHLMEIILQERKE